jgi:hypothetical protein
MRILKKRWRICRQEGVSPPPCFTPFRYSSGRVSAKAHYNQSIGNSLYLNRGRQSGGPCAPGAKINFRIIRILGAYYSSSTERAMSRWLIDEYEKGRLSGGSWSFSYQREFPICKIDLRGFNKSRNY